ncbi:DJ-1/PfpI family protein [Methanobrevibacter sp. DSM 116169]|uniref:nucleotide-binding protein n=1 Tax=Methanobrevibacter sp. DSM 116169 TaxID=3242727 RepID=UPI0038FCD3B3
MKIGITYIKGSLPGFENFGNLPTDIVNNEGLTNGIKASKELDALIIPGGTLLESGDTSENLLKEIKQIASDGKPVIGICSGFQLLSNSTDIGRNSPRPIIKEGLGLIDLDFSPLVSSDKVEAISTTNSFLTKKDQKVTGFHSHTYGKADGNAKALFYSKIKRMNYKDTDYNILSGAIGDNENVLGTLIHNILDENTEVVQNFFNFLDLDDNQINDIYLKNKEFKNKLNYDLGINSNVKIEKLTQPFLKFKNTKKTLMILSTGSDSGKTFITTGLAGALRKRGLNVGLIKIGPDVRDIIPGLYLTKGKMEDFSSVKIGHIGWMEINEIINQLNNSNYDIILIEGVMSAFTGLLNEKIPYSGAEIAASSNIPVILTTGVNKGGIESAAIDLIAHKKLLDSLNINTKAILLNKVYSKEILNEITPYIEKETNTKVLSIDKIKLDKRGNTPEVEIDYDKFSSLALNTIEDNLNIEKIANMSEIPKFNRYLSFDEIKKIFR